MRGVIYGSDVINNSKRLFGASTIYYPADFMAGDGSTRPMLFTALEVERAIQRAEKNPEDIERRLRTLRRKAYWAYFRAFLWTLAAIVSLTAMVAMLAGCAKRDTIIQTPDPPLVTCADACKLSCGIVVPLWQPPDASKPEAFDFIRPQVVDPLAAMGQRCDERRAACWACIESIERAGVIRLPGADGR